MNVYILGRMQEGKSTLAVWVALQHHRLVIVWDPRHQWEVGTIVYSPEELEHAVEDSMDKSHKGIGYFIVYQPGRGPIQDEFAAFSTVIGPYGRWNGGYGVIIDEAKMLQGSNWINEDLDRLVRQSKNAGPRKATIIQTTHRLQDLSGNSRSLIHEAYFFQVTFSKDLEAIREFTQSDEVVETVKNLPPHHFVRVNLQRGSGQTTEFEVVDDPTFWYVPMEAGKNTTVETEMTYKPIESTTDDGWKGIGDGEKQGW